MWVRVCVGVLIASFSLVGPAFAQSSTPTHPPSPWRLSLGGGIALTQGNKDTSTYNASYTVAYAPHPRRTFKSDAFLIRGRTNGDLSNDKFALNVREEYRTSDRVFIYGQNQYARDRFKRIQYMVAPTGGVGLTTIKNERTTMTIDVGAGGVWEKNPYADVRASGALTFNQKATQAISTTTTLTQGLRGLWKTEDLADAVYQLALTAALAVNSHVQVKIEAINSYNTKPTGSGIQKNDISMVFALAFRN
jgi:putative salt-induced outer membrane protein YdiY